MLLKWNEKEKGYGAWFKDRWYRSRLNAQQELKLNDVETTLQFDHSHILNHGWYLTDFENVKLEGLVVDLPFNPFRIVNLI